MKDESGKNIFFIDEINRANIPMVMGELLTIIESTKRVSPDGNDALTNKPTKDSIWGAVHVEPELTKYLRLPDNLHILATMNTSDDQSPQWMRHYAGDLHIQIETMLVKSAKNDVKAILENKNQNKPIFLEKQEPIGKDGCLKQSLRY